MRAVFPPELARVRPAHGRARGDDGPFETRSSAPAPLIESRRSGNVDSVEEWAVVQRDDALMIARRRRGGELNRVHGEIRLLGEPHLRLPGQYRVPAKHTAQMGQRVAQRVPRLVLGLLTPEQVDQRVA